MIKIDEENFPSANIQSLYIFKMDMRLEKKIISQFII